MTRNGADRLLESVKVGLFFVFTLLVSSAIGTAVHAAPYAAMVIDARNGEVLHSRNADTRLHPASLTKMMTLYVAFEAVENGEISLDTKIRISQKAAAEEPSKLGLRPGQRIALRYLIRAAAVKSANDAATAIAEAISGSEAKFARRMNRTARALGMTNTTFKNAHGLTETGHMSTARDMTTLGRHLFFDYPDYYHLFSRRSIHAGIKEVNNTNRRFLGAYRGADGIKTGYTRAAGFNLVASAERGNERIITTVFGGRSTATRNAKVAELMDLGFSRAPSRVAMRPPAKPAYGAPDTAGKTIRVVTAVKQSLRPIYRPGTGVVTEAAPVVVASAAETSEVEDIEIDIQKAIIQAQETTTPILASVEPEVSEPEIVTRISTSGERHWGINVGRYESRFAAEKMLLKTALAEMSTLDGTLRKVVKGPRGFDANFVGMTPETADLACRRLQARQIACFTIGPS